MNNIEETKELLQMESNDDDVIKEDQIPVDEEVTNEVNEAVDSSRKVLSNNTEPRQTTTQ